MTELNHNSPRPYLASVPPTAPKVDVPDYPQSTLSLKLRLGEIEMSWTLRGDDADVAQRLPRALATIRQLQAKGSLPAPTEPSSPPASAAPQPPLEERPDWCSIHQIAMLQQQNAQGSWWSHKTPEGAWCKGKRKRAGA
jgi:hypothetical protein